MNLKNDWEFNILGIYNYNQFGNLKYYFDFIRKNHNKIEGDIVEAGVFQGRSLLATAMLLKEVGSKKKVIGYDTFSGFPVKNNFKKFDDNKMWTNLFEKKQITKRHFNEVQKNKKILSFIKKIPKKKINYLNSSSSNNFSNNSLEYLKKKINFLKLNNVVLVKGQFKNTINLKKKLPKKIFCSLIDADLYESYLHALPNIYENLSINGYICLDEYYSLKFPGPRLFCDQFVKTKKIKVKQERILKGDFPRFYIKK